MSVFTRMHRGWHLGFQSLKIVSRDKTLLLFPLMSTTCAMVMVAAFYVIVGPDKVLFFLNTLRNERGVQLINWGYYENALMAYILLALLSTFFAFGLVACTRITLDERDSKLVDGMTAALRNCHWVFIWAFIAWTIGPFLNLLDHQRHTSRLARKVLKTSWSILSYFVVPIVIVDRVNIFSAVRRSVSVMTNTWGEGAVSQLGLYWFFFFMNVPTLALFGYGHYLEGPWPRSLTFVVLAMIYGTIVVYQTASSVLSVVLYKYALDGTVVTGFNKAFIEDAFVHSKANVLVGEEPKKDTPSSQTVAAPSDEPESASTSDDANTDAPLEAVTDSEISDEAPMFDDRIEVLEDAPIEETDKEAFPDDKNT